MPDDRNQMLKGARFIRYYRSQAIDVQLVEEHLGIAVPPDDAAAFAGGLIKLADNYELRRLYGMNARKYAEHNFSRERLANEFVSFLESSQ